MELPNIEGNIKSIIDKEISIEYLLVPLLTIITGSNCKKKEPYNDTIHSTKHCPLCELDTKMKQAHVQYTPAHKKSQSCDL